MMMFPLPQSGQVSVLGIVENQDPMEGEEGSQSANAAAVSQSEKL